MKIKKKMTRKQFLKQEDEFITTSVRLLKWTKKNYNKLLIAGIGIFVVLAVILTIRHRHKSNLVKSQNFLASAIRIYEAGVRSPSADPNMPLRPDEYNSYEEKYNKAIAAFEQIIELYPDSQASEEALFYKGNSQYNLGKYDEAIQGFTDYLNLYPNGRYILQAKIALAFGYQERSNYKEAIAIFSEITNYYPDYELLDSIYMQLGFCYENSGDIDNATKSYQEVIINYPDSPYLKEAEKKIELLKDLG